MAKKIVFLVAFAAALLSAQTPAKPTARLFGDAEALRENPTYSSAILRHVTPEEELREEEAALAIRTGQPRFRMLGRVANAALSAGKVERARELAQEALDSVPKLGGGNVVFENGYPVSRDGDAVFYGHLVLGRIALLNDDVETAKKELLLAGTAFGSPMLDSFGPNMSLARELLLRSERDTVLKFLAECRRFWKMGGETLDWWTAEISSGEMPTFGVVQLTL